MLGVSDIVPLLPASFPSHPHSYCLPSGLVGYAFHKSLIWDRLGADGVSEGFALKKLTLSA